MGISRHRKIGKKEILQKGMLTLAAANTSALGQG